MFLLQLQFGSIFHHDHPFRILNETAQNIQNRSFTGRCSPGNNYIFMKRNHGSDQFMHIRGQTAKTKQFLDIQFFFFEFPDGNSCSAPAQRRNHGMDTGTIRQPGIQPRIILIEHTSHGLCNIGSCSTQRLFTGEHSRSLLQFSAQFHIYLMRTIDHNFRNLIIFQIFPDRSQKQNQK